MFYKNKIINTRTQAKASQARSTLLITQQSFFYKIIGKKTHQHHSGIPKSSNLELKKIIGRREIIIEMMRENFFLSW